MTYNQFTADHMIFRESENSIAPYGKDGEGILEETYIIVTPECELISNE